MDEISDEFETWPDQIICLSNIPLIVEKPVFDLIISMTYSVLMGSTLNLQIRWTWMKSWINLKKFGNLHNLIELYT